MTIFFYSVPCAVGTASWLNTESSSDASVTSDPEKITIMALWSVTPCGWVDRYHHVREDMPPVNVVCANGTFRTWIDPDRPQHKHRYYVLSYYQIFLIVTNEQLNFTSCHLQGLGLKKICMSQRPRITANSGTKRIFWRAHKQKCKKICVNVLVNIWLSTSKSLRAVVWCRKRHAIGDFLKLNFVNVFEFYCRSQ